MTSRLDENGCPVWGQFVGDDRLSRQYGIFGSAAAVNLVAKAGYQPASHPLDGATSCLDEIFANPTQSRFAVEDVELIYKLIFLLDARRPTEPTIEFADPVVTTLVARIFPGMGWGFYTENGQPRAQPHVLPTAMALHALARCNEFRIRPEYESAYTWLRERIEQDTKLNLVELAYSAIALSSYTGQAQTETQSTKAQVLDRLASRVKKKSYDRIGDDYISQYSVEKAGHWKNHYFVFPVDLLVARALILLANPPATRQYVLNVVIKAARSVSRFRAYRSQSREKLATADQVWAWDLFREFERVAKKPADVLRTTYTFVSSGIMPRIAVSVILVALVALGLTPTFISTLDLWVKVLGATAAALIGGLAASLWFSWIRRDP